VDDVPNAGNVHEEDVRVLGEAGRDPLTLAQEVITPSLEDVEKMVRMVVPRVVVVKVVVEVLPFAQEGGAEARQRFVEEFDTAEQVALRLKPSYRFRGGEDKRSGSAWLEEMEEKTEGHPYVV
ncbi:hypothetical protein FOZ62_016796, partial [Perkinsus olseni]